MNDQEHTSARPERAFDEREAAWHHASDLRSRMAAEWGHDCHHGGPPGGFPFGGRGHGHPWGFHWHHGGRWGRLRHMLLAARFGRRSDFSDHGGEPTDIFDEEHEGRRGGERPMKGHRGGFGGERGFGGFGFGGRGRSARRPFEQGDLRWIVLELIASQPRHGYEIIKAIEDALDGHYSPSPGVIYPTLTLLEETGLIAGETQGAKKLYSITDAGRAELEANAAQLETVRGRLKEARADFGGVPSPEMMRAMGNLRHALQLRLAKGGLTREAIGTITAAIDRAAGEIERS
ncbi:MAG: PadR family transcriptional regulator [Luteolibacter sp.]